MAAASARSPNRARYGKRRSVHPRSRAPAWAGIVERKTVVTFELGQKAFCALDDFAQLANLDVERPDGGIRTGKWRFFRFGHYTHSPVWPATIPSLHRNASGKCS